MFNKNQRKFGYMASVGFQAWTVEEVTAGLAHLGYAAVEWTLAHFDPHKDVKELLKLVSIPEKHGMEVSELVVQQDFVTPDSGIYDSRVQFVEESIVAANKIGVSVINLFTGPAPWDAQAPRLGVDISEGDAWNLVTSAYEKLLPIAEKNRVFLAVEPVFGHICHDYYSLMELLRRFDSEYLAVNFDPSHFKLYGNDIPWVIKQLGPYIHHVHLKDVVGKPGFPGQDFTFPLLGEGTIDWIGFTHALDKTGYQGALSVEFEAFGYFEKVLKNNPISAAELSMQQIKHLIPEQARAD